MQTKNKQPREIQIADGRKFILDLSISLSLFSKKTKQMINIILYVFKDLSQEIIFGIDTQKILKISFAPEDNKIRILGKTFNNYSTIDLCKPKNQEDNDQKLYKMIQNYTSKLNHTSPMKNVKMK